MAHDGTQIHTFVMNRYQNNAVQKIVESWRVEPADVIEKLVEHYKELGIYVVPAGFERMMMESIIHTLKTSPDIQRLVIKARQDELKRQRNRHAD